MSAARRRPAQGWPGLAARLDALTMRERALALLIALGLLYAAWSHLLFAPLDARRAALLSELPQLEQDIGSLNANAVSLALQRSADPDAAPRTELEALRREAARLESRLVDLTGRLVPPRRMAAMLESVLSRETDLRLLRLAGLGAERVQVPGAPAATGVGAGTVAGAAGPARAAASRGHAVEAAAVADAAAGPAAGLYRHGLRIEFAGSYLQTLAYLRALESLPSGFLWQGLELEVERYPVARVAITVHSLSLDDAWIGI